MPSKKKKWSRAFDKQQRNQEESAKEPETPPEGNQEEKETPLPEKEGNHGACGTSADEKPGGRKMGRWERKRMEAKMSRSQRRREASPDPVENMGGTKKKNRVGSQVSTSKAARGTFADEQPATRNAKAENVKHVPDGWGQRASENREDPAKSVNGRGKISGGENQDQPPERARRKTNPTNPPTKQNKHPPSHRHFPGKSACLEPRTLKDKSTTEVIRKLNEGMAQLTFLLGSKQEQHNSDDFLFDLTCTLATACRAPPGEDVNKVLAALRGSVFLKMKIPCLLTRVQASIAMNDHDDRQKLFHCLIMIFRRYLTHLPSSYAELPYVHLKLALDKSSIEQAEELKKELGAFKQARDDIITAERLRQGKRHWVAETPSDNFRDIPICPTDKEITTQERPFLRKNILKGKYENADHYLDVQFRLLREDFLEPLREGIQEIAQNIPRQNRKQMMKNYHGVRIVGKEFTRSGIIHQVKIDVTGLNPSRWVHSKRLIFGSFLCLSKDNFKTMLFATVSKREPDELTKGRIDIRFIEGQNVVGVENRGAVYQMVESPAYFEAYRHVLKGLKELDETTLPFQKYLVQCRGEVDPPEYLRHKGTQDGPICYDLSKALDIPDISNARAVPVLFPGAWPSVKELPLNNSQLEALRTAITTEFSVIQGPPGTGKTYVGAKIVRSLLENRKAWDYQHNSPMLMVCFTNHALDQFLEKVLEFLPKKEVIRVGGRCRSQTLEDCNLKNFTSQHRLPGRRKDVDRKMRQKEKEMAKWKKHLENADEQQLEFDDLEDLLHFEHADQLCNALFPSHVANNCRTPKNTFKLWLCNNDLVGACNQSRRAATEGESESDSDGSIFPESIAHEVSYDALQRTETQDRCKDTTENPLTFEKHDTGNNKETYTFKEPKNPEEQKTLREKVVEVSAADKGVTEMELEANLIQDQRQTLWHEVLRQPISDTSGDLLSQEQDTGAKTEDISYKWQNVPYSEKEKRPRFPWQKRTNEIELEASLIEDQRRILGDEELLQPISEKTEDLPSQEQDTGEKTVETKYKWQKVPCNRKGDSPRFPWQKTNDNFKSSGKKNKDYITGDISLLKEDLERATLMSPDEVFRVDNIWNLSHSDRRRLYLFWVESYRERCRLEIRRGEQEYEQLCEQLEVLRFEEEEEVIRRATVVGMTTTGAARYHKLLQRVAPRIVVIEEAAEVMEAHIITSLSRNTKHAILIGDHKQLRPKATVYELAQKYNLEVSLFERMVTNNMECKRLSIQHRMRPEIAALTKRIYDHEIIDHDSVCHLEDIAGVCHNVFFIDHCEPEHVVEGLQSYANDREAEFLVALCKYLICQGYRKEQITILTMYIGQLLLLQKQMPREEFEGVKVCAVDNFQGEENDIILLSLVRSNSLGRIGFLSESNRICVALSRARQGFYCIGNFNLLKNQSKLWSEICVDLKVKDGISDSLPLVCKTHSNVTSVKMASDFNLLGGCNKPCGVRLPCGHACDKNCHASSHVKGGCSKMCLNRCPNNHSCLCRCHHPNKCPKCFYKMSKTVPKCGHEQQIPCCVNPEDFSCRMNCEKMLPCGHKCDQECGGECTTMCRVACIKSLPCGHEKRLECHKDPDASHCNSNCKKLLDCGHPCSTKCREKCKCNTTIEVQLSCGHIKRVLCRKKDNPIQCLEKCKRKLDCGHDCPGICNEDCKIRRCETNLVKDLPCGHKQSIPCYQDPQTAFCSALCPRQLDCGHRCSSVCGRPCHEVQCDELCQKNCEQGHPCQKRCHLGSVCGDCNIQVDVTISACGHSITKPCHVDQATLRCKQPCERMRNCGHPCKEICGGNCEARPCKVQITKALECKHVANLECHKNPENHQCKEVVEILLPCGHKTSLGCHLTKAGIEKVQCKEKVFKELRCGHKLFLPCFRNPEDCTCRQQVNIQLLCGHKKSFPCCIMAAGLPAVQCTVKVQRTLPCDHMVTLPCYSKLEEYKCKEEVQITLACGHKKLTTCPSVQDELQVGFCVIEVTRKLHCGHEKKIPCSHNLDKVFCDAPCERYLPCGHLCSNKCGIDCTTVKCAVPVKRNLSCGHEMSFLCSEDVTQRACSSQCNRPLMCGHQCPGKCFEDCRQYKCKKVVIKNLNCAGNHSCKMPCSKDPSRVPCQERCVRNLPCGHPCPGLCSEPCESTKCKQKVENQYPCGHKNKINCFESKAAFCQLPCRRREKCKHQCKGVCGKPCSEYPCNIVVSKMLSCGHQIKRRCSFSVANVRCPAPCGTNLPCGHQCSGKCDDCQQSGSHPCNIVVSKMLSCGHKIKRRCSFSVANVRCSAPCGTKLPCGHQCSGKCDDCHQSGSHKMCRRPCSRLLVCLHRCKAKCSEPCPPCDKECSRQCPHAKCTKRCSQLCEPCNQPCCWICPHYQCSNTCGEECDRPRCDAPCERKLPCQHPCIGLCGENCPTLCAICDTKKLSSLLGGARSKLTETTRFLQLFNCGHILTVDEMDSWMMRALGSDVQLIRCPRCSSAISFSFRYSNLIKRTLKSNESVKREIYDLTNEAVQVTKRLLVDERNLRRSLQKMKFPKDTLAALQRQPLVGRFRGGFQLEVLDVHSIPFIFTLKSHLFIMHRVQKAQLRLQKVATNHVGSKEQLEMQEQSAIVKQSLDDISEYLMQPQLDLSTLHQVHEHTRKFSLFASILEARHEAIKYQRPLSSNGETRLKMAGDRLNLFFQGNDDALQVDWLEMIANSLRKEVGLASLPPEEPKTFENFPGFSKEVWKLCEHREVYFTRSIVRAGEDALVVSKSCTRCVHEEESD